MRLQNSTVAQAKGMTPAIKTNTSVFWSDKSEEAAISKDGSGRRVRAVGVLGVDDDDDINRADAKGLTGLNPTTEVAMTMTVMTMDRSSLIATVLSLYTPSA